MISPLLGPRESLPATRKQALIHGLGFSNGKSASSPKQANTLIDTPISPKLKRKHPNINLNAGAAAEKRTWNELVHGDASPIRAGGRGGLKGVIFDQGREVYTVSTFIPRASFKNTQLVEGNVGQKMVVDLPGVKVAELRVGPGQSFKDFVVLDGFSTGYVLRAPKGKLLIRIHTNERLFSMGDSFFVPTGNSLSVTNSSEKFGALLQLTIVRKRG